MRFGSGKACFGCGVKEEEVEVPGVGRNVEWEAVDAGRGPRNPTHLVVFVNGIIGRLVLFCFVLFIYLFDFHFGGHLLRNGTEKYSIEQFPCKLWLILAYIWSWENHLFHY